MRCSACGRDTPASSFSAPQREEAADLRTCAACAAVGRETGVQATPDARHAGQPGLPNVHVGGASAEHTARPEEGSDPGVAPAPAAGTGRGSGAAAATDSAVPRDEDEDPPPCCTICLDGGDEPRPIQRGCACRGDMGLAHTACMAQVNAHKAEGRHGGWYECPTCKQDYTGAMSQALAAELVRRLSTRAPDDPDRVASEDAMMLRLRASGTPAEAGKVAAEVLAARKRALGEDHPATLEAAAMLAESEALAEKARAASAAWAKQCTGHSGTLDPAAELALKYHERGKLAEAEELQVEALAGRKRDTGVEHPDTLAAAAKLAHTHHAQGKFAEAEELQVGVLAVRKRVLGAEHPDTLESAAKLAHTHNAQGKFAEAEELLTDLLATQTRVLGAEHVDTLLAAILAHTYLSQGKFAEAEELLADHLATQTRVLGAEHPMTLVVAVELAKTQVMAAQGLDGVQGKFAEAEELMARVVPVMQRVLCADHSITLAATFVWQSAATQAKVQPAAREAPGAQ